MSMSRREALGSLSAFALLGPLLEAQSGSPSSPSEIKIFRMTDLPATRNASGVTGRGSVPKDILPLGDLIEVHITSIDAGKEFGPMSKNPNYSFRLILAGKMEILPEGMPSLTAAVGDMVYTPANTTYQVRNSGDALLSYFVIQLKPRTASS